MTGRRWERKLVRLLESEGWRTVPAGSSGSGTSLDRPDLVIGNAHVDLPPLGIEAKTTSNKARTIDETEAKQLRRWCDGFGAEPVIAVYWKRPNAGGKDYGGWWFRRLEDVRRSPSINADGGHHLRPRREDREEWAGMRDLNAGRLNGGNQ